MSSIGVVSSESWIFFDHSRGLFSIALLFSDPRDQLMRILETFGYLIVMPDMIISMLVIATGLKVIWQAIRRNENILFLPSIDRRVFIVDMVAATALVIIAVPTTGDTHPG